MKMFTEEPHPKGGILRRPLVVGRNGKGDLVDRVTGERLPEGAELGIGEDGKVYVWFEDDGDDE